MYGRWLILPIKISVGEVDNILTSHVVGNEVLIIYTYPNSPGSEHVYLEECHVVQSYNQKLNINKVHVQMWRFHWNQQKKERKKECTRKLDLHGQE